MWEYVIGIALDKIRKVKNDILSYNYVIIKISHETTI